MIKKKQKNRPVSDIMDNFDGTKIKVQKIVSAQCDNCKLDDPIYCGQCLKRFKL